MKPAAVQGRGRSRALWLGGALAATLLAAQWVSGDDGSPPKTGFRERNLIRGKTRQGKGYHKLRMKQSSCISNDWKPENSVRRQAIFFAASHGRRPLLLPRRIPRLQHLRPCNSSISAE